MTKTSKYRDRNGEQWLPGAEEGSNEEIGTGLLMVEFLFEAIKIFWNKIIVTIAQSWEYDKN